MLRQIVAKLSSFYLVIVILLVWEASVDFGLIERFLLPSPSDVVKAFIRDYKLLLHHSYTTLLEAFLGTLIGTCLAFVLAIIMAASTSLKKLIMPPLIITQTVPTIAIAPVLVLWCGYGILSKVILVAISVFFPIVISLLHGFASVSEDTLRLFAAMRANFFQRLQHALLPHALPYFFSGLRVSLSYALIGAVVAEWLGGFSGLGVYMSRAKKAFMFDTMFAIIFLICALSLLLMWALNILQHKALRHHNGTFKD